MMIMRELTGGLYFGERKTVEENGVRKAIDTLTYDENNGLLRQGNPMHVDGRASHEDVLEYHFMAVYNGYLLQNLFCLPDDFRPDAVAGNTCDM